MADAFGHPGLSPTWTSSDKDLVTTAIRGASRVWLTLGHGIANEVYWPSTGEPQIRDIGFIVGSGSTWTEVKRLSNYTLTTPKPAVLVPTITHEGPDWTLRLEWTVDPQRDVILIDYQLDGNADALYLLVAPHLGTGTTNTAWTDDHLHAVADGDEAALSIVCTGGFEKRSAGYVGSSDGWQDLTQHNALEWEFDRAAKGNVALTGQLPLEGSTIALSLAATTEGATLLAKASLAAGVNQVRRQFTKGWTDFAQHLDTVGVDHRWLAMTQHSAAVLACHEDQTYPGAMVASLSIPWGNNRSDLGGYHLVWARDCVESALARLAVGDVEAAERTLVWLCAAQQEDGHWTQNAYPDGRPFWNGVQLDEVALPVILAAVLRANDSRVTPQPYDEAVGTMVRKAVHFLAANGPSSPQDRWEEDAGVNAFTLSTVIAALIASAPWLESDDREYAASLADYWNTRIEDWLYAEHGDLSSGLDIAGYYTRLGSTSETLGHCGRVNVANRGGLTTPAEQLIACDFLALSRFGLRSPNDQRMIDTVTLIDSVLAVELPTGVAYRRYNGDGYGEHDDGEPFDGTGVGRPWPLLAGERGHFAAQSHQSTDRYLGSMQAMTGKGMLLPEQVWDAEPIASRFLSPGHPTGSAMPLAWAHAEFIKLATEPIRGCPIEQLDSVRRRYEHPTTRPLAWHWRVETPFTAAPSGSPIMIDHSWPFILELEGESLPSLPLGLGRHGVRLKPVSQPLSATLTETSDHSVTFDINLATR